MQPFGDNTAKIGIMEEEMGNYDIDLKSANVKNLKKRTDNVTKSMKCNKCDFASSEARNFRRHLKTHSGEKSNKCNQSSEASNLRKHLITHIAEKSNRS